MQLQAGASKSLSLERIQMRLNDYRKKFAKWCDEFDPEGYGYTWEQYENGEIDLVDEFVLANYGNSSTAQWLRQELKED